MGSRWRRRSRCLRAAWSGGERVLRSGARTWTRSNGGSAGAAGPRPTRVMDGLCFKSVYFLDPGGVLFEIATAGPGFAVDEAPAHLGEALVLPPFLEPMRGRIESALPPLRPAA